jgi:hypothetical protein
LLLSGVDRSNQGYVELNHAGVTTGCDATGIEVRDGEALVGGVEDIKERGGAGSVVVGPAIRERATTGALALRTWVDARATLILLLRDMSPRPRRRFEGRA